MFISDEVVFVELHKTACTHIDNLMCKILHGKLEGKHNKAYSELFNGKRQFIGSIRNPWDWYVSLWAFGCEKKGGLYKHVTDRSINLTGISIKDGVNAFGLSLLGKLTKKTSEWEASYKDVNDPACFKRWLKLLHDPRRSFDFGEGYGAAPMHNFAGLLTYRYFNLFCSIASDIKPFSKQTSLSELVQYDKENCFIDSFIRNENLESDFLVGLEKAGISITEQHREIIFSSNKTNVSQHDRNTAQFFDEEANRIILNREKFIIEKFGYKSPLS
ncbi:sulfotransferase family 2 domain-containing protein [Aliiglaciecola sp. NS0011-25]|uniref:sulfotransferase family 2 domain-containing protein n=1 Tax=Aliiglaciecola sp. NS0011-25 TaxID=3127654 RepID=UPI0031047611